MLYSNKGNKNSDACHVNVHADRIFPAGRSFPTPVIELELNCNDAVFNNGWKIKYFFHTLQD